MLVTALRRAAFGAALVVSGLAAQQPIGAAAWRADIHWLDTTLKAIHPAPHHRVPRAVFDAARDALLRDLPRLDDRAVALRLTAWVALLHDGHSQLIPGGPLAQERVFPIRLERFVGGIHVVAVRPGEERLLGTRVVGVGGMTAERAWDSLAVLAAGDNPFSKMFVVPFLLASPPIAEGLGVAGRDSLPLVLVRGRDTLRVRIGAVPRAGAPRAIGWQGAGGATVTALGTGRSAALTERHREMGYWYAVEGGTLYAQINQVGDVRDSVDLDGARGVVTLAEFTARVFRRIDAGGIDRLVVDLRHNRGGDNALVRPFVEGIAARPALDRRGKVFVITGRATYSAAMNFVSLLDDRTQALFVGEPAGGAPSHYGDAVTVTLPKSGLAVRVSTLHWDAGVAPRDIREWQEPDLPAPPRFGDLAAGVDGPMEVIGRYRDGDVLSDAMLARYRVGGMAAAVALLDSVERAGGLAGTPWGSRVQQVLTFAERVIGAARAREDIFAAFALATDRWPDSPSAWAERARVLAFINDWAGARAAYERGLALRPANVMLARWYEVAKRR